MNKKKISSKYFKNTIKTKKKRMIMIMMKKKRKMIIMIILMKKKKNNSNKQNFNLNKTKLNSRLKNIKLLNKNSIKFPIMQKYKN